MTEPRQKFNNDPRWRWVDLISDLLAILLTIETHRRYIGIHAGRADMHNVVTNLQSILNEVNGMSEEIQKLKARLGGIQVELIKDIYQSTGGGSLLVKLADHAGSSDVHHAYMITEGDRGRRWRRVKLADYVGPESEGQ